jgi:hypothetical protein
MQFMANITFATFVIGAEAAESVRRQLADVHTYLEVRKNHEAGDSLSKMARHFERLLSASSDGFDTLLHARSSNPFRVIWRACEQAAGILYVVKGDELQSLSLVLSGMNRKAEVSAIDDVGRALSPVNAYFETLAVVRFGRRPMVATFCSRIGGLDKTVDLLQLAFAGVFFERFGLPSAEPQKPSTAGIQ